MSKGISSTALKLVVGITVLIILGAIVFTIFSGSIEDLSDDSEDVEQTGCDYQREQYLKPGTPTTTEISDRCEQMEGALTAQKTRLNARIEAIRRLNGNIEESSCTPGTVSGTATIPGSTQLPSAIANQLNLKDSKLCVTETGPEKIICNTQRAQSGTEKTVEGTTYRCTVVQIGEVVDLSQDINAQALRWEETS